MPNVNSVPEVLYEPNQPYHYYYDNLPLRNIITRIGLINIQVDTNADMIRGAAGSAGSIDSRLGVSMEPDGSIKKSAIDSVLHGIGSHEDGEGPDGVAYVRMTAEERAKLAMIQSESNRLLLEMEDQFPTIGSYVTFTDGTLRLRNSSTIFFDFEAPNVLKAHSTFPPDVAHRHHYDKTPVNVGSPPDYRNYKTTSLATPYAEGSLRVYVNGVRLSHSPIPVPSSVGVPFTPTFLEYESASEGLFRINRALTELDEVRIDFDQYFFLPSSSSSSEGSSSSSEGSSSSSDEEYEDDSSSSSDEEYEDDSSSSSDEEYEDDSSSSSDEEYEDDSSSSSDEEYEDDSSSSSSASSSIIWVTQPSNQPYAAGGYTQFSWSLSYADSNSASVDGYEYSDDGTTWFDFVPHTESAFSSLPPDGDVAELSGTFSTSDFVLIRRYRVRILAGPPGGQANYYSDYAFAVCPAVGCSAYWPVGWSGPAFHMDCGLIVMPGYQQHEDCSTCQCVSVPISSSSSSDEEFEEPSSSSS